MPKTEWVYSWTDLLVKLGVDPASETRGDLDSLVAWCRVHIKSTFHANTMEDARILFKSYLTLNTRDIHKLVDESLGYTVLHKAAKYGFDSFLEKILMENDDNDIEKTINLPSKNGNTALHLAALFGHYKILQILIDFGADIDLLNNDNKLPITLTCSSLKHNLARKKHCLNFLLMYTNPELLKEVDKDLGKSFLMLLMPFDDLALVDETIRKSPAIIDIVDFRGQNILHHAIMQKNELLIERFSNNKKLLLSRTNNGSTTWHIACRYGDENTIRKIQNLLKDECDYVSFLDEHQMQGEDYLEERNMNYLEMKNSL